MRIPISRDSTEPIYQQIANYFRENISNGNLPSETRLPATRHLAESLGVNRITVEKAYAQLEMEGLIESRIGSGTYVSHSLNPPASQIQLLEKDWPQWHQKLGQFAHTQENTDNSPKQDQLIDFSGGMGAEALYPVEDFRMVFQRVFRNESQSALSYGDPRGYEPFRKTIAQLSSSQGMMINERQVLVTNGSSQAMALVANLLLKPGDTVLVEAPTYIGALELYSSLKLDVVTVPVDEDGMMVERLEMILQKQLPKLIYTMPNFHNPTGTCLSIQRRYQLLQLANQYNVPIFEDDYVGDLRYGGRSLPALKALDRFGNVIYTGTFSKMIMPGLRIGYLIAEGPAFDGLVELKRVSDLASSNLMQRAVHAYLTIGRYQSHIRRSCRVYRKRRDAMAAAIEKHLSPHIRMNLPQGGLFCWLNVLGNFSVDALRNRARAMGVDFAPGRCFFVDPSLGKDYLRLNFSMFTPEEIETGIQRLAVAFSEMENA
jgi:GntR family transcriptional regulator/MocR family aminotransferase